MKTRLTTILAVVISVHAAGSAASAAVGKWRYKVYHRGHVATNSRCRGISYGTGARSCGTATGGPVSGIGSRN